MTTFEDHLLGSLRYDPETGVFVWAKKVAPHCPEGRVAGTMGGRGYISITCAGRRAYAHRVAWLFQYGSWPTAEIDHVNGDKSDNRICNLRLATRAENNRNVSRKLNRAGLPRGVRKNGNRFEARIRDGERQRHLGCFPTAGSAGEAYRSAAISLHGEFRREEA